MSGLMPGLVDLATDSAPASLCALTIYRQQRMIIICKLACQSGIPFKSQWKCYSNFLPYISPATLPPPSKGIDLAKAEHPAHGEAFTPVQ